MNSSSKWAVYSQGNAHSGTFYKFTWKQCHDEVIIDFCFVSFFAKSVCLSEVKYTKIKLTLLSAFAPFWFLMIYHFSNKIFHTQELFALQCTVQLVIFIHVSLRFPNCQMSFCTYKWVVPLFYKLSVRYYGENEEVLGRAVLHLTAVRKLKRNKTTCILLRGKKRLITNVIC